MTFTMALMIAVSYWGARGVQTPCHPTPVRASTAQLEAMYGPRADGQVYMYADTINCRVGLTATAADDRYWMPSYYCLGVIHEVGHLDGLSHAHGGVMQPDGGPRIPWACTHVHKFLRHWRATH